MQLIARGLLSFCALGWAAPVAGQETSSHEAIVSDIPAELPPEPSIDAASVDAAPVEFDGIQPGVSTLEEVQRVWGEPVERKQQQGLAISLYSRGPFEQVEVAFSQDKVQSIALRLQERFTAREVAEQLELSRLKPAFLSDEDGVCRRAAYPERGVVFSSPSIEPSDRNSGRFQVSEIVLGEIHPRLFLLRAQARAASEDGGALADLDRVLKQEPASAAALRLRARILSRNGRADDALEAIEAALEIEPENPESQLAHAELSAVCGHYDEAVAATKQLLSSRDLPALTRARGLIQWGELIAAGPAPDYQQPVALYQQAIRLAEPYADDPLAAVRTAAFEVLVDAHLATAYSIAWGRWKNKAIAAPKWIERAETIADGAIEDGDLEADCSLRVCQTALAACVGAQGTDAQETMEPAKWAERAAEIGRERLAQAHDPLYRRRLQWQLGLVFNDALQVCQLRQELDAALKHGQSAIACLENGRPGRQETPEEAFMLGRLYYRLAVLNATHLGRHPQAVALYEMALPLLDRQTGAGADAGRRGEELATAAISYWNERQRDRAMSLTRRGIELLEQAARQGDIEKAALAVPYANLAAMHEQLGDRVQAASYSEQATNAGQAAAR
ncbi:MAG TPA: tetratricopeptide repeat protein [Pirellulales bacterium]|nr:tetratricopeptide repeat protein [Pirellulales bacterium]